MVFYTQITMEAGEDNEFLDAMRAAHIKGALVGVEAVTPEGLKAVFKDFNSPAGADRSASQTFKPTAFTCSGRLSLACPTDKPDTFDATAALADEGRPHLRPIRHDDALSREPSTSTDWEKNSRMSPRRMWTASRSHVTG